MKRQYFVCRGVPGERNESTLFQATKIWMKEMIDSGLVIKGDYFDGFPCVILSFEERDGELVLIESKEWFSPFTSSEEVNVDLVKLIKNAERKNIKKIEK